MARLIAALAASAASLALAACGGGGGNDDNADKTKTSGGGVDAATQQADRLVEASLRPNAKANSGVVDGQIEVTLKGVKGFGEPFTTGVSGPFSYRKGAALPDYELELGSRGYGVTLTSKGGRSYVTIGTTGYALPASIRNRLIKSSSKGRNGLNRTLEQFGVAPARWETERKVAGSETLDGVQTTRIKTSFNAGRILRDANTLLGLMRSLGLTRVVGLPPAISPSARRRFVKGVTTKVGESWIADGDKVLRQSGFTMRFAIRKGDRAKLGGITGGSAVARLMVTEVGKPQTITAPTKLGSFEDFKAAIDALGEANESK
jgi:hypothetical protein